MVFAMLAGTSAIADTEIHRCLLEDGTVAFQETPCPDPAANADDESDAGDGLSTGDPPADVDEEFDFTSPFDEPADPVTPSAPKLPAPPSKNRAQCEKATRDAIDAIDLKLQKNANSQEQGQGYLAELLALTNQLRACKQL